MFLELEASCRRGAKHSHTEVFMVDAYPVPPPPPAVPIPGPLVAAFSLVAATCGLDDMFLFQEEAASEEPEGDQGRGPPSPVPAEEAEETGSGRRFACELCPSRFNQSSHLTVHQRAHSGEKPFGCDLCPARFA